ncbi:MULTISPECIES: hypothetical protein [Methylobacterium]|uniref:Uncharacterized protein n=2 Tax=Methylobacterium TaxID=407 RepID=A0A0C6FR13_9HYPH|nr:hypothetical protein [Methylobacterium aquaticum]BAQ49522.1 conserved hypothetical protein [Methylobacterium aquaticum]
MYRTFLAALALACVCSPAMALGPTPAGFCLHDALNSFCAAVQGDGGLMLTPYIHRAAEVATVAQPATDTAVVTIPYGSWLTSAAAGIQEIVVSVIMAIIAIACRRLPAAVGAVVRGLLTQQLVERAIAFGMSTVAGAAAGKTLSVPVGNAVLANALSYAVEHAPGWFLKWAGGEQAIRDHIIALLPMDEQASLAPATATAVASQPTPVAPV